MSRNIHTRDHAGVPRITNLKEYLFLKEVRANTALIGGKIIYNGREWDKAEYEAKYPVPTLKYNTIQIDGKQIEM